MRAGSVSARVRDPGEQAAPLRENVSSGRLLPPQPGTHSPTCADTVWAPALCATTIRECRGGRLTLNERQTRTFHLRGHRARRREKHRPRSSRPELPPGECRGESWTSGGAAGGWWVGTAVPGEESLWGPLPSRLSVSPIICCPCLSRVGAAGQVRDMCDRSVTRTAATR